MSYNSPGFAESIPASVFPDDEPDVVEVNDRVRERLANKFMVAGGSARWMFGFALDDAIEDIKLYVQTLSSVTNWFKDGFTGIRSDSSVSHLFSVKKDQKGFIVSEFVGRLLSEICQETFLKEASANVLCRNPTFDGWIFEADFLYQVRKSEESKNPVHVYLDIEKKSSWSVSQRRKFSRLDEIVIDKADPLKNVWYIPEKWNQACYDAVYIEPDYSFSFIQVTCAMTHSLKLKYIVQFLDRFERVNSLRICFVVPNLQKYKAFDIKIPEGKLSEYEGRLLKCEVQGKKTVKIGKKKGQNKEKEVREWFLFGINRT